MNALMTIGTMATKAHFAVTILRFKLLVTLSGVLIAFRVEQHNCAIAAGLSTLRITTKTACRFKPAMMSHAKD